MNLATYQAAARKTAVYPTGAAILYPAVGLAGELGEVYEVVTALEDHVFSYDPEFFDDLDALTAQAVKELGDVAWYLAALASDLQVSLQLAWDITRDKKPQRYGVEGLVIEVGKLLERVKRIARGDAEITSITSLEEQFGIILILIDDLANDYDANLSTVLTGNIKKLQDRQQRNVLKGTGNER